MNLQWMCLFFVILIVGVIIVLTDSNEPNIDVKNTPEDKKIDTKSGEYVLVNTIKKYYRTSILYTEKK